MRETERRNANNNKQAGKGDVLVGNNMGKSAQKHQTARRKRKQAPSKFETEVQATRAGGGNDANTIGDATEQ